MKKDLISFEFQSPIRIGIPGRDEQAARDSIPADQLFSVISLNWIKLYGIESFYKEIINSYNDMNNSDNFAFKISDAFPVINGKMVFPTPKWLEEKIKSNNDQLTFDKKLKTNWISINYFVEACNQNFLYLNIDSPPYMQPLPIKLTNNVNLKEDQSQPFYSAVASIPENTNGSKNNCQKKSKLEFKCLINYDCNLSDKLNNVFKLIEIEGIGGNRSSGYGQLSKISLLGNNCEEIKLLKNLKKTSIKMLLSACIPSNASINKIKLNLKNNHYILKTKSGWVYDENAFPTDIRKPVIHYIDTGSYFDFEPIGQLIHMQFGNGLVSYKYGIPFVI